MDTIIAMWLWFFAPPQQNTVGLNGAVRKRLLGQGEIKKSRDDIVESLYAIKSEADFTEFLRRLGDISRDDIPENKWPRPAQGLLLP